MSKGGVNHFDSFDAHTLLKHLILSNYVNAWAEKLSRVQRRTLWFVDAFAGEGRDAQGNPGSPVIAARIAARLGLNERGRRKMRLLAIEKDPERKEKLEDALRMFNEHQPRIADVRQGTLGDYLERFIGHVGTAPVLFFLDPFGVKGLPTPGELRFALSGPHNEVFALFSDLGARRLHATLLTDERDIDYEVQQVLNTPSFFPDMDAEAVAEKRREVERSNHALRHTQQASLRILAGTVGGDALEELRNCPPEEVPARLKEIYMRRLREAGARYVISFPVRDSRNAAVYQLVYASKSKQGLRTMKESMQTALNSGTLPKEVRDAITYEVRADETVILSDLRREFAGETVRWAEAEHHGKVRAVYKYLIEETPLFPPQIQEIKQRLIDKGFRVTAKPLVFSFPSE